MTSAFEWQFGGGLRLLPPAAAWSMIGGFALAGLIFVVWLYRRTLRELSPPARLSLIILRVAIVLMVLLCLANPTRVDRHDQRTSDHDTLAVVVDRSDSMSSADYRGSTRLASAVRLWKQHESEARAIFSKITYQRFAVAWHPAKNLEDALSANEPGSETHLYAALTQALTAHPGAIVCLTDGLDTTTAQAEALIDAAQQRGVRLYFVAGKNRVRAGEMLAIREIKAPPRVLRQMSFTAGVLLEIASAQARELPIELWSGATKLASARLPVRGGWNTLSWMVPITAAEAGPMPLEFRIDTGAQQRIAACTTQVVDHTTVEILYYQGALQWGYRFLRSALESDPSFRMTSILNPALHVRMNARATHEETLADLPEDLSELKRFQIIVLAHAFPEQLTGRQQQALLEYARGGGGVLFIAPDTGATEGFARTPLEQMLPVVFESPGSNPDEDDAAQRFRDQMKDTGEENDVLLNQNDRRRSLPPLQAFALPPGAERSAPAGVFQDSDAASLPHFSTCAKVRGVKPGASILAVAGPARDENSPRILLARQQFGEGFTVALTTDLLWRWKMSLPSSSHAVEKFWQQLLLSLTPESGAGLRAIKLSDSPAIQVPVLLRIEAASAEASLRAEAISPAGERQPLVLEKIPGEENAGWRTSFVPSSAGQWEVRVTDTARNLARLTFPVMEKARTTETMNLPPDVEAMRRLAESTGGALIEDAPVFEKRAASESGAQIQRVRPLWNAAWLLVTMLGLYATELIVRRCCKLL